ncbi:MAG: branched-chain amino acid ABC transporter permease [Chloroflexi bacterium]|nr:branched-chain amino acid ABC transporter permease [Chloroflexota bacterium]
MTTIVQNLVFGLFVGSIYGITAVGLALVFGVMKMLNIAHGELLMVGGYVSFWLFHLAGLDPFVSLLISVPLMFGLGVVLNQVLYRHIARFETEHKIKNSLLVSFGLTLFLQNLAQQLWTADERSIQTAYSGVGVDVLGIALPYGRMANLGLALVTVVALHMFLSRTDLGKAIRATADEWESAILVGVNIRWTYLVTFGLSASLAAVAGALVALGYGLSPSIGLAWTLKAMVVVVLAGTGSIFGVFPAGLLLGVGEAVSGLVAGAAYREVFGLLIFVVILIVRPQGLFGRA